MKRTLKLLIPIFAALLILLMLLFGFGQWSAQLRSNLYPGDKITGTVTLEHYTGDITQTFSHPGGKGTFSFLCGTPELPVTIIVESRQDWHMIDAELEVSVVPDAWRVYGVVCVSGYEPLIVDESFSGDEEIVVTLHCFP